MSDLNEPQQQYQYQQGYPPAATAVHNRKGGGGGGGLCLYAVLPIMVFAVLVYCAWQFEYIFNHRRFGDASMHGKTPEEWIQRDFLAKGQQQQSKYQQYNAFAEFVRKAPIGGYAMADLVNTLAYSATANGVDEVKIRAYILPAANEGSLSPLFYVDLPYGYHKRASYIRVGEKLLIVPPMEDMGLYKREDELVPVHNVTDEDMRYLTTGPGGRTFSEIFSVMRAYQSFTGRVCMGMHELSGYKGPAKRIVGIMTNDGQSYIHAVNPIIVGNSEDKQQITFYSSLCPHRKHTRVLNYAVSLKYTKFDSLVRNRLFKETNSNNKHQNYYQTSALNQVNVEREWFNGKEAACLQVLMLELAGVDLCHGHFDANTATNNPLNAQAPPTYYQYHQDFSHPNEKPYQQFPFASAGGTSQNDMSMPGVGGGQQIPPDGVKYFMQDAGKNYFVLSNGDVVEVK